MASAQTWWNRTFVVVVLLAVLLDLPSSWPPLLLAAAVVSLSLAFVRPPRTSRPALAVASPLHGRWVVLNSPASRVPSHGVRAYAQDFAIDVLHPSSDGDARRPGWGLRGHRPEEFSSFGEAVHAVADGTVVRSEDGQRDHRSSDTWPTLVLMLTVGGFLRELAGWTRVIGNHVVIDHGDHTFSLYAHLRRGSVTVSPGDVVVAGRHVADVGSTGNTSEPHLHLQLMDRAHPTAAAGLPWRWSDVTTEPGDLDRRWGDGSRGTGARVATVPRDGVPPNGQIFTA